MKNGNGSGPKPGTDMPKPEATRREFLKVLGVAGAGAAAVSCGPPDTADKLIPYLVQPDEIIPGTNTLYATALRAGAEPVGVHAVVRDGRIIKLEGDPDFEPTRGRLSALDQSVLQDLYDPDRVTRPRRREGDGFVEASWDDGLEAAKAAVARPEGALVLLTGPVTGATADLMQQWAAAAGAEHVVYEPFGLEALRTANVIAFGRNEIPSYELDRADLIVSFGADFLETWLAPVELAGRFARARDIESGQHAKLAYIGPRRSLTGTNADEWVPAKAGSEALVALGVARVVAAENGGPIAARLATLLAPYSPGVVADASGIPAERIEALGREMAAARAPVALPPGVAAQGADATDAHFAVTVLNAVVGAIGNTVRFSEGPIRGEASSYSDMAELTRRMTQGEIGTVIVSGCNPVYSMPAAGGFAQALGQVSTVISLATHMDETASGAGWILPAHHALEAWGDIEVRPSWRALAQPAMQPLFDTRQMEDILLGIAPEGSETGPAGDFKTFLQDSWRALQPSGSGSFERWWRRAVQAGGARPIPAAGRLSGQAQAQDAGPELLEAATNYRFAAVSPSDGTQLVVSPTVQMYDGRGANRSWMQELPDPVTRIVWNSWVELHPDTAEELGVRTGDVVEVSSASGSVQASVYIYRGIRPDTVGIPLGQGHTAYGRHAAGRGVNALDLLAGDSDARSGALAFSGTPVQIRATGERSPLAVMQGSDTDLGREIAEIMGVAEARTAIREHHVDLSELVKEAYDSDPKSPYRWGMSVDLNACTGCGACVTACYAENNIPAVGEALCAQGREMSWMQIERFYEETNDGDFQTVYQPVMCQQCGDAPCEPVCPVYATYHTPEGLNAQIYNRCVGTRYCANNCPYKVRRFNWYTYEFPYPLNLQLNPDVTVRETGVMEKCSFCVQRINRAKNEAKREGRLVADGEIVTACMQTCPTHAITFGNLKDPESEVSRKAKSALSYHVLDELNTRPAVTYRPKVTHAEVAASGHEDAGH